MNIDESSTAINNDDAVMLYKFITGDPTVPSLGVTYYTFTSDVDTDLDNVSNLLIIDGHYDKSTNIPFNDFITDSWVVHEKFFNYLLNMSIQKYSNSEDITYLQSLIVECWMGSNKYTENLFYPGHYSDLLQEAVREFQLNLVNYTLGDLNRDNVLDNNDLKMLRGYLDNQNVINYNLVQEYLLGEIELTEQQIAELDVTEDGKITNADLIEYQSRINAEYSAIFRERADVNSDGSIDELDYIILQNEINGVTDNLKQYQLTFNLGWCDVETESQLELNYNINGTISEVSK